METEKVVNELYSLRAGLSLIAKEMDTLNRELKAADMRKTTETAQARAVTDSQIERDSDRVYAKAENNDSEYAKAKFNFSKADTEKAERALAKAGDDLRQQQDTRSRWKSEWKSEHTLKVVLEILFLLFHLGAAVLSYYNIYALNFKGYIFLLIVIASVVTGIFEIGTLYDHYDEDTPKKYFHIIVTIIVNVFSVATNFALMIIGFGWSSVNTAIVAVIAVSAGLSTIITFTVAFVACKEYLYWSKRAHSKKEEAEYTRLEAEYNRLLSVQQKYQKEYEQLMQAREKELDSIENTAENEFAAKCAKIEEQFKKTCAAATKIHVKTGTDIWNTLVNKYGSLLDVRDWKILDLVIWQLETHRAESLREALQLADRETQTDRIIGALQSASEAVRYQIKNGFSNLQSQLNYSFNALATEFKSSARSTVSAITANMQELQANQTSNMLAMSKGFDQIVSQASLQTALLEKADTSSTNLLKAIKELREAEHKTETN